MIILDYFKNLFFGDPFTVIAQCVGLIAMGFAIGSFQMRTQKNIMLMQTVSGCLFTVHFLMLGAVSGGVLNAIGVARSLIFAQRSEKEWAASMKCAYVFIVLIILVYPATFLLFGKEPTAENLLLEALPMLGMIATTFSFRMEKASMVRAFSTISSPLWLAYNLFNHSVGGVITEAFSLISILVGILRMDIKRKNL